MDSLVEFFTFLFLRGPVCFWVTGLVFVGLANIKGMGLAGKGVYFSSSIGMATFMEGKETVVWLQGLVMVFVELL